MSDGAARLGMEGSSEGETELKLSATWWLVKPAKRGEMDVSEVGLEALDYWCRRWLGGGIDRVLFRQGHLSLVVGLQLADGRRVVVKVRPWDPRIPGCWTVHRHLWRMGFPCPEPLSPPRRLDSLGVTAEALVPGGDQFPSRERAAAPFAQLLATLVRLTSMEQGFPTLEPAPPWLGWDHGRRAVWPLPDDLPADLDHHPGPAWLDALAQRVRHRLRRSTLPPVIGHGDWESQNLRWMGSRPYVVHDWDSVVSRPEAAIAGAAGAVFTATGDPLTEASIDETESFLAAYAEARGHPWSSDEYQVAWAAGLWVRTFNAKKAVVKGDGAAGVVERLAGEAPERMDRAGA